MVIYSILAVLFGSFAAYQQKKKFRHSNFVELFITFFANGILFPLVIALKLGGVLKSDKVVTLPRNKP